MHYTFNYQNTYFSNGKGENGWIQSVEYLKKFHLKGATLLAKMFLSLVIVLPPLI